MKTNKKPFYLDYMTKERPKVPRCICTRGACRTLGIISPSLYLLVKIGKKGEKANLELETYERNMMRYMCYKRTLNKEKWKVLYRERRKKIDENLDRNTQQNERGQQDAGK